MGIATQRPELRSKFPGRPEQVVAFMAFVAEEVRHTLAAMGYERLEDIVGRFDLLDERRDPASAKGLDLSRVLKDPDPTGLKPRRRLKDRNGEAKAVLDERVFQAGASALERRAALGPAASAVGSFQICNQDRSVGARLSGYMADSSSGSKPQGRRPRFLRFDFRGVAGQSFGVFLHRGLDFRLIGEAQDYVGKGLAGGRLVLRPSAESPSDAKRVIAGNTLLYGATGGELFAAGAVGERFAVRNSGATAVVEGCGDHGCEYMTGGTVVVLGTTGRNFGAGMSGGEAFVLDPGDGLGRLIHPEMVTLDAVPTDLDGPRERLESLLRHHLRLTGSVLAASLLDDQGRLKTDALSQWTWVVPKAATARQRPGSQAPAA